MMLFNTGRGTPCVHTVLLATGLAVTFLLLSAHDCVAQVNARKLISTAVEKYDPKYNQVEAAIVAFRAGDTEKARTLLVKAKKEHPELAPADVMLAFLYMATSRRREAEVILDRALVNSPDDPEAYIVLADIALREKRLGLADLGYQRARTLLKDYKSNPWRQRNLKTRIEAGLASICESRNQFPATEKHLEAWMTLAPKNPVPVGSLGRVKFRQKQYPKAREFFVKLKELDEGAPPPDIAMGQLYANAGLKKEALQSMKAAVKESGDDLRTRVTVASWALSSGLVDFAKENIDAAIKMDDNATAPQVLAARLARQQGDTDKAESLLSKAVLQSPNDFTVTNELARTLAISDDTKKRQSGLQYASRNFQIQRNRNPVNQREAILTFAWLLLQNGRPIEAEAALNSLPGQSSISKECSYYAGAIYAKQGKNDIAINALRAALAPKVPFPGRDRAQKLLDKLTNSPGSK